MDETETVRDQLNDMLAQYADPSFFEAVIDALTEMAVEIRDETEADYVENVQFDAAEVAHVQSAMRLVTSLRGAKQAARMFTRTYWA